MDGLKAVPFKEFAFSAACLVGPDSLLTSIRAGNSLAMAEAQFFFHDGPY